MKEQNLNRGKFILIEGIEGSGKTTVADIVLEYFEQKGLKKLDIKEFWLKNHRYPRFREIKNFDLFYTREPTKVGVGSIIREEILSSLESKYTTIETASFFAVDRLVLYRKLLIPLIKAGKIIVQERGIITGLATQLVQAKRSGEKFSVTDFLKLPGNRLALEDYPPNLILFTDCKFKTATENRVKKNLGNKCVFYSQEFQKKVLQVFKSRQIHRLLKRFEIKYSFVPTVGKASLRTTKSLVIGHLMSLIAPEILEK
jgi:dTMP kinase